MSGRGLGLCAGYGAPGFMQGGAPPRFAWVGRGGGGRGWRHWFYATGLPGWARYGFVPPSPEQEKEALKGHAKWLEDELAAIRRRIEDLEKT